MLTVQASTDPALRKLLSAHPKISAVGVGDPLVSIAWAQGEWNRAVVDGVNSVPLHGLVELTDNNPMVCADSFSVPEAASTLALIAIGPLAEAGLIVERPTILINADTSEEEISPWLQGVGWNEGLTVACEDADLSSVIAATVMCAVTTPDRMEDLDDLFDERYGRSFFVRRNEDSDWHVNLVLGQHHAAYRLRVSPGESHSLLTIQVMADKDGKCGAAQVVHAFNVMCGLEESLGLE